MQRIKKAYYNIACNRARYKRKTYEFPIGVEEMKDTKNIAQHSLCAYLAH